MNDHNDRVSAVETDRFYFLQQCELIEAEITRIQSSTGTLIQLYGFFAAVVAVLASMTLQGETAELAKLDARGKLAFVVNLSVFYLLPLTLFIVFAVRCLRSGPVFESSGLEKLRSEKIVFRQKILIDFRRATVFLVVSFLLVSFSTIHIFVTGSFPVNFAR